MNRLEPCGTDSARRRHLARVEGCRHCRIEGPRLTVWCGDCRTSVPPSTPCGCPAAA